MDRASIRRTIREHRRFVSKSLRDCVISTVEGSCEECGAVVRVGLAYGVAVGIGGREMAMPPSIPCVVDWCDGDMRLGCFEYEADEGAGGYSAYLRVPSRRAAIQIANEGHLRPQVAVLDE